MHIKPDTLKDIDAVVDLITNLVKTLDALGHRMYRTEEQLDRLTAKLEQATFLLDKGTNPLLHSQQEGGAI